MRLHLSLLALVLTLLAPIAAVAQESAGRVLTVVGDVAIERGPVRVPARADSPVLTGDTIHLGPQSNAQVRFTDDSVVALGSDTSFRVSEYQFSGIAPEAQRVFFNLLKGGMRTVTGLIGRTNRGNYGVRTITSSIGIRGTSYAACVDCTGVDGQVLPGTTIGFSEGSGSLTTQAGELLLATGESGYAADLNALPVRIPSLPQTIQQASARPKATTQQAQAPAKETAAAAAAAPSSDLGAAVVATAAPVPVFQATSAPNAATLLGSSFSGTSFYRLSGPLNLPTSCASGPCGTIVAGEITLGANFSLQRVTANAAFKISDGEILTIGIPITINSTGLPINISGNQATFSGTFNRADYPFNSGSFRCSDCGPNHTSGFIDQFTISGTINGAQATVTLSGHEGSFTAVLPQQAPPNNSAAAIATPALTGGDARSYAYWNVRLDSAGRLLEFGPVVGGVAGAVGGATNTIVGTAPSAGNLVWGTWTNGNTAATKATVTDRDFATFQPSNGSIQAWVTGDASNSLPPSLGTLTFNPIGSVFNSTNASVALNSARLIADFVNHSLQLSINARATPGATGTNVYQMNATTGFSPTINRFSAGFNTVTCTGPCNNGVGTASGAFGGFFAGPQAQGAGVAFSTGFGSRAGANGVGNGVSGAIAFGR